MSQMLKSSGAMGVATMVMVRFLTAGRGIWGLTPELTGLIAASAGFLVVYISRLRTYEPERAV